MPSVYLASDHRGFKLKEALKHAFPDFVDLGPHTFDPEDDYNDAALAVAKRVQSEPDAFGVLICGSAIGISIQANRFKKVRAAVALTPKPSKPPESITTPTFSAFLPTLFPRIRLKNSLKSFSRLRSPAKNVMSVALTA